VDKITLALPFSWDRIELPQMTQISADKNSIRFFICDHLRNLRQKHLPE
jgi:hypothetical protein